MRKKVVLHTPDPEKVAFLVKHLAISERIAALLVNRGVEDLDEAKWIVSGSLSNLPSPFLLKDMKKAVLRIIRAIEQKESIFVYGDYDVDGVTATSILLNFFTEIGVTASYHIPHRIKEGYGLHVGALEAIQKQGGKLVITADCGISNVKEAEAASRLGIDLIVTDHHIVPPELPDAHAVLNPLRKESEYPDLNLAGVGVAFQLLLALRSELREQGFFAQRPEPNLKNYLDLVALGTIADLVSLRGVNHVLVKEGLALLSLRRRAGIKALLEVSNVTKETVGTYEVGFQLAPRLNAGGRISSAERGVSLLTTVDFEEALGHAQHLDGENSKRRFLQEAIFKKADERVLKEGLQHHRSIVLSDPTWHPGIIGIVASKLVEKYYRPTLMISEQEEVAKGSARSIKALHLVDSLRECADLFKTFGGHKAAAGFSMSKENITKLKEKFEVLMQSKLSPEDLVPVLRADMKLSLVDVDRKLMNELEQLAPFGMGFPEPVLISDDFSVKRGTVVGNNHLKLQLEGPLDSFSAIGFYMGDWVHDVQKIQSIAYSPFINEWQGRSSIELKLKEISV